MIISRSELMESIFTQIRGMGLFAMLNYWIRLSEFQIVDGRDFISQLRLQKLRCEVKKRMVVLLLR